VAAGRTDRETAATLFVTEATIKTHLLNIYAKLGVSDRRGRGVQPRPARPKRGTA
jgi:DNA-binding CsgD family transcriptional regulator